MNVTTVGSGLVKNVFSAHGKGKNGKVLCDPQRDGRICCRCSRRRRACWELRPIHGRIAVRMSCAAPFPTHDHGATLCRAIQRVGEYDDTEATYEAVRLPTCGNRICPPLT